MNKLLNEDYIKSHLTHSAKWCQGHGAIPDSTHLGGGLLYYALIYTFRPYIAVVLGSGGGFVPRMIRQAQRDTGIGHTILVDANVSGWGRPDWVEENSFFRSSFPDVEWWEMTTEEAARKLLSVDYLHIDADHSRAWTDFYLYRNLMSINGVVTIHDTVDIRGPREAVEEIKKHPNWEIVNLPIGAGIALARRIK